MANVRFTQTGVMAVPSRATRRAAANREAIIDAAAATLAETGLAEFAVDAVAERADVAVQTIYNRVGGRTALLLAVAHRALVECRAYMDAVYEQSGSPGNQVLAVGQAYIAFAAARPAEFRLLLLPAEPDVAASAIAAETAALIAQQNAKLAALLSAGVASGEFHLEMDPQAAADTLWAMTNGLLQAGWQIGGRPQLPRDVQEFAIAGIQLALRGILAGRSVD